MITIYDKVSYKASKTTTLAYSTSFSMGIKVFHRRFHAPIYAIYGFVRLADEIVDTFHEHDKVALLARFREDTFRAIEEKISLNPILHSFQDTIHRYSIEPDLVDTFLQSMEMDLSKRDYDEAGYKKYILGSAEVVGLMCLRVFLDGNETRYQQLKPHAMSLGSAFQKINFLRDLRADYHKLGRTYFPDVDIRSFTLEDKKRIEADIEQDFRHAAEGIDRLPRGVRLGVRLAYIYYLALFRKIRRLSPQVILDKRVRIPNSQKYMLLIATYLKN